LIDVDLALITSLFYFMNMF